MAALFNSHSPVIPRFEAVSPKKYGSKKDVLNGGTLTNTALEDAEPILSTTSTVPARDNKKLIVEDVRVNRTIFMGNISSSCSKKQIKQLLKGYGSIESIRLRSVKVTPGDIPSLFAKRTHKLLTEGSTFNAYVVFSSDSEAEACLSLNGTVLQGRHLRVDVVGKRDTKGYDHQKSVFVGNLSFSADEEKLRDAFSICGAVDCVRIVRDSKSGIGKGFGFVTFSDNTGVMFALQQNKKINVDGRTLRVSKSRDQHALQTEKQTARFSGIASTVPRSKPSNKPLPSQRITGKKRPDGTKNRYYRVPVPTA